MCIDYTYLNRHHPKDPFPLPHGFVRGTRWLAGSSAGRMVARIAR
jgi:hypothetical protein